ncbi:MAG: hypothetical protein BGO98_10360 [Myxococcales bacterium 68-20]|nr:hypothetical protein [Myxococcales bacterium]OJY18053.1 MAG: hypothetical protein BGO98_10360 [Myxococcales bacterium 68-20]
MTAYELSSRIARRAYEGARIRRGLVRACGLGVLLGLIAVVAIGGGALAWLPVFAAVWTFLEWRGGALLRGGRVGALFGALVALVPTSLFMACCRLGCSMAGGVCCNTSRACAGIGALVGLGLAALLARLPAQERSRATLGAALGVVATAVPRCAGLMVGEGLGLVLGLIVGTAAAGVVCTVVDRIRQPAM